MKITFAILAVVFGSGFAAAGSLFDCDFTATEGLTTKSAKIKIVSPDVGAKVMYMSNGELIFAVPNINDSTAQLDFYVGGSCDSCSAVRFYQTDAFQKGLKKNFSASGAFTGDEYAKSIFSYKISCAVAP